MTEIAIVTTVRGRHDHLRAQRAGLAAFRVPVTHVVVGMGDPDLDGVVAQGAGPPTVLVHLAGGADLPLAAARNVGVDHATGLGAAIVVLLDVDCIPAPDLAGDYGAALDRLGRRGAHRGAPAVVTGRVRYLGPPPRGGYDLARLEGQGDDHPARVVPPVGELVRGDPRLLWTLNCALTTADFERIGGFDEDYTGYGGEDTDFGQRLDATGGGLWWTAGAGAWHQHHAVSDPPVEHLDAILRNANRFRDRWGWFPMEGWLDAFADLGLATCADGMWRRT